MYIPLDNLYDWIADISDDTVIYRWTEHGSKNISNLKIIDARYQHLSWQEMRTRIPVVCHDQEPLQPELYDWQHLTWQQMREQVLDMDMHHEYRRVLSLYDEHFWRAAQAQNLGLLLETSTINDRFVILHSEQNSDQWGHYQDRALGCFWWSHAMIARDWYRYAQHDRRLQYQDTGHFVWDFNVYARAWSGTREYRLFLLAEMAEAALTDRARVTFAHHDQGKHYLEHEFAHRQYGAVQDLSWVEHCEVSSHSSASYDADHYQQCAIDVVTETVFEHQRQHLTEKILRPIACAKPFLLLSSPGSLAYLRHYGFRTFHDLVDESYDSIADPVARIRAVTAEMMRLCRMPLTERAAVYRELHLIARQNQQHFFSDTFAQQVTSELRHNLTRTVDDIRTHWRRGQKWLAQQVRLTPEQRGILAQVVSDPRYRSQRRQLLQWCRQQRV